MKKKKNMDFCKLLLNLMLLNVPSQESVVPSEFLEAFITAHNRHSTVFMREKNSGAAFCKKHLCMKSSADLLTPHTSALLLRSESEQLKRLAVVNYHPLIW